MSGAAFPFPPVPSVGHVAQMRAADPHFVGIFVEGPDDFEMWARWLRHRPLPCDGCVGVRRAIDDVRNRGVRGCVGIVDADLDRIRGVLVADNDVVVSEKHDHECDLVCSLAFDNLLLSIPQAETEFATLARPHATLREAIRERAVPFGRLRWFFRDKAIEFPSRLTPANEALVSRRTWSLDDEKLFDTAALLLGISRAALDAEIAQRVVPIGDEWHVCNGHDVVALLRLAFATVRSAADRCRSEKSVGWALRSAVDSGHLATLSMWQQLANWESRNEPFLARR